MNWLLRKIERIRGYPESVRVLLLWVSVGIVAVVVGAVWALTFSLSLKPSVAQTQKDEEKKASASGFLPDALAKEIQDFRANLPSLRTLLRSHKP